MKNATMFRIIQKRNYLFAFSLAILIPGMIAWSVWGLRLGIDFTGGSHLTVTFNAIRPPAPDIAAAITKLGYGSATAQTAGEHQADIRLPSVSNTQRQAILDALNKTYGSVSEQSFDSIGPVIGRELLRRSVTALILVLIAIVLYISWAFRRVGVGPVPAYVYGLSAVLALFHDLLVVVGIFAILGHYLKIEIDSYFVTALLTVLGFSVHDTIVVFDRIRERLIRGTEQTYEETVNVSLNQTLVRSLNTSLTTLLVLTALELFGGTTIRNFILALLIGIASGTYSSIFVASPLLVVYERWKANRRK